MQFPPFLITWANYASILQILFQLEGHQTTLKDQQHYIITIGPTLYMKSTQPNLLVFWRTPEIQTFLMSVQTSTNKQVREWCSLEIRPSHAEGQRYAWSVLKRKVRTGSAGLKDSITSINKASQIKILLWTLGTKKNPKKTKKTTEHTNLSPNAAEIPTTTFRICLLKTYSLNTG